MINSADLNFLLKKFTSILQFCSVQEGKYGLCQGSELMVIFSHPTHSKANLLKNPPLNDI